MTRYIVQVERQFSKEIKEKYPNLRQTKKYMITDFMKSTDLRNVSEEEREQVVRQHLTELQPSDVKADIDLQEREEVKLIHVDPDGENETLDLGTMEMPVQLYQDTDEARYS